MGDCEEATEVYQLFLSPKATLSGKAELMLRELVTQLSLVDVVETLREEQADPMLPGWRVLESEEQPKPGDLVRRLIENNWCFLDIDAADELHSDEAFFRKIRPVEDDPTQRWIDAGEPLRVGDAFEADHVLQACGRPAPASDRFTRSVTDRTQQMPEQCADPYEAARRLQEELGIE
jgi:hypothetical protein